jgi:hypothetical protein
MIGMAAYRSPAPSKTKNPAHQSASRVSGERGEMVQVLSCRRENCRLTPRTTAEIGIAARARKLEKGVVDRVIGGRTRKIVPAKAQNARDMSSATLKESS